MSKEDELTSIKVLVVNPSLSAAELMAQILISFRSDVVKVASSPVDLEKIVQHWIPDLIICESIIFESENIDFREKIQQMPLLKNIPLILTISPPSNLNSIISKFQDKPNYLLHPFTVTELMEACDTVLLGGTYYHTGDS